MTTGPGKQFLAVAGTGRYVSHGPVAIGMTEATAEAGDVTARYYETDDERVLAFERERPEAAPEGGTAAGKRTAAVAQNVEGYAMLKVRPSPDGDELERYYGFDVALDHAAELLGVSPNDLPVPEPARNMGM